MFPLKQCHQMSPIPACCSQWDIKCNTLVNIIVTNLLRMPSADVKINWFHKFSSHLHSLPNIIVRPREQSTPNPKAPDGHRLACHPYPARGYCWHKIITITHKPELHHYVILQVVLLVTPWNRFRFLHPRCWPHVPPSARFRHWPVHERWRSQIESDLLTCDIYHQGLWKLSRHNNDWIQQQFLVCKSVALGLACGLRYYCCVWVFGWVHRRDYWEWPERFIYCNTVEMRLVENLFFLID